MTRRAAAILALLAIAHPADAAVRAIWAVNDGEKVERDDRQHPSHARNSAWDGHTVRVFGARNEVLAVQVIVEADAAGISELSVGLPELRSTHGAPIRYEAPAHDPSLTAGRPIQIFVVHYMQVTSPSRASWIYEPGSPAAPKDPTGWKPVQLVPENARAGRGGLPVRVAPDQNQAIWIEIYTGRDRPAGMYRGTVVLTADGVAHRLPIELELFDFTLPDAASMHAMVYYESGQPLRYQGRNLDPAYHRTAHRHRIELVTAYDEASVRANLGRFSGEDFTAERGYDGPGAHVGNTIVPRTFYGPGTSFDNRPDAWRNADSWVTFLRTLLPNAITFLYMPDEPRSAQYPRIRAIADNIHSNPGPGRSLPTFVTSEYVDALDGAIDIWCSVPYGFRPDRVAQERARGRRYWFYNGMRPASGAIVIDAPATDARVNIWAAFKHDVDVYFFWHGVHWHHNTQKPADRDQNVWANPVTFDNRGQPRKPVDDQGYINGDGVLFYPGEERIHPEEDRGLAGPVTTIQLANLRRGLQDHQYLTLARERGQTAVVDAALRAIVPRVFAEAGPAVSFAETGDPFEQARLTLARAIVAAKPVR